MELNATLRKPILPRAGRGRASESATARASAAAAPCGDDSSGAEASQSQPRRVDGGRRRPPSSPRPYGCCGRRGPLPPNSSARVVRRLAVGWVAAGCPAGGAPARLVGTTPHRRPAAPCWGDRGSPPVLGRSRRRGLRP